MSDVAIRVEALSKRYRIGHRERYYALRDVLARALTKPFRVRNRQGRLPHAESKFIWALKDVSFDVRRGEAIGIIGRNGVGKTTLLKILSRITEPTEGSAEVRGRVGSLLEVGTGFHPELTGRENTYLNGAILGMKKAEIDRKFDEIVAFAEVEKFLDTPVKHYSSGMYVRLAFAVAAHLETEILLVDEVLAVGDAMFQKKCLRKMEGVGQEGRTVLFVSHNLAAVASLCQRGILLSDGTITVNDTVDKAVAHYTSSLRESRQVSADGSISLSENHPGRLKKGEGAVRLTHCRLLDRDLQSVTSFRSGDEARIVIGYEILAPLVQPHLVFAVACNDSQQRRLFGCSNELVGQEVVGGSQKGEVQCVIPRLPLVAGTYTIDLGCKVGTTWSDGVYAAAEFGVVAGNFFGPGRPPPEERWGSMVVDHYWLTEGTSFPLGAAEAPQHPFAASER